MPSRGSKPKSLATPSVNGRSGRAQLLPAPATPLLWGRPSPSRGASPARAAGLIGLLGRGCRSHRAALAEDWYEPLLTAAPWKGPSGCARPLGRRRPRRLRDNAPGPDDPNQRRVPGTDVLGLRGGGWRRRRPDHRQHRGRIKATRASELRLRDAQQVIAYALLGLRPTRGVGPGGVPRPSRGLSLAQARSHIADALNMIRRR